VLPKTKYARSDDVRIAYQITGDGFLATFDGPARAVRCALVVRQLGIEVRAGVHSGECELMGDNVGGIAVHSGARIMGKAEPEVCLSPEPLKISFQVPELIFKITASTSSKEFPASGDSSRRAPDSRRKCSACGLRLCRRVYERKRRAGSMVKRQMRNLRQRYRWLLRNEVAHIVQDPADVNDEIRYLCAVLCRE
jgi:hypothetical protein